MTVNEELTHLEWSCRYQSNGISGALCCGEARESIEHLSVCAVVGTGVFDKLRELASVPDGDYSERDKQRFDLFTVRKDGARTDEGLTNLNLLLWKQLNAAMTRMETEDEEYDSAKVWAPAWLRFEEKAKALAYRARQVVLRAEDRGTEVPDVSKRGKSLLPFGEISEDGELIWDEEAVATIKTLGKLK